MKTPCCCSGAVTLSLSAKDYQLRQELSDGATSFCGTLLTAHVVDSQLEEVFQHCLDHNCAVGLVVDCLCQEEVVKPLKQRGHEDDGHCLCLQSLQPVSTSFGRLVKVPTKHLLRYLAQAQDVL